MPRISHVGREISRHEIVFAPYGNTAMLPPSDRATSSVTNLDRQPLGRVRMVYAQLSVDVVIDDLGIHVVAGKQIARDDPFATPCRRNIRSGSLVRRQRLCWISRLPGSTYHGFVPLKIPISKPPSKEISTRSPWVTARAAVGCSWPMKLRVPSGWLGGKLEEFVKSASSFPGLAVVKGRGAPHRCFRHPDGDSE